jgi:hypothetical protein
MSTIRDRKLRYMITDFPAPAINPLDKAWFKRYTDSVAEKDIRIRALQPVSIDRRSQEPRTRIFRSRLCNGLVSVVELLSVDPV